jgi:serine/threonine protein kinase
MVNDKAFSHALRRKGYVLKGKLGHGGMGEVHIVTHVDLDVDRVLKVILPGISGNLDFQRRFDREQRVAAQLGARHRSILTVHDFGTLETGQRYSVTTFYAGGSLASLNLPARTPHGVAVALDILGGVASALGFMGEQRPPYVHRDVKPENVLVGEESGVPYGVLGDFGLARAVDDMSVSGGGSVMVSAPYGPPELWRGDEPTPGSDIYALAITVLIALTGANPIRPSNPANPLSWRTAHLTGHPAVPTPREDLLVPIADLARHSLAKDAANRPSAVDWEDGLRAVRRRLRLKYG